jgi:hypothetical protein
MNFLIDQPVEVSMWWVTASAANTMAQVSGNRLAFVVVDRPGTQVMLGHPDDFSMCHSWW